MWRVIYVCVFWIKLYLLHRCPFGRILASCDCLTAGEFLHSHIWVISCSWMFLLLTFMNYLRILLMHNLVWMVTIAEQLCKEAGLRRPSSSVPVLAIRWAYIQHLGLLARKPLIQEQKTKKQESGLVCQEGLCWRLSCKHRCRDAVDIALWSANKCFSLKANCQLSRPAGMGPLMYFRRILLKHLEITGVRATEW